MTYDNLQAKLKDLIDNSPMSTYQIIIVAICFILNMNDGIDVLVVSFTGSEIVKEWALSKSELGSHGQINNLLSKMGHEGIENLPEKPAETPSVPLKDLFLPEYKTSTTRLWLGIFFGFLTL